MKTSPFQTQSDRLFDEAEIRAERLVALLRMALTFSLGLVFGVTILGSATEASPVLVWQWTFAGSTMLAYFLLGFASYIANLKGVYKPWMVWLAVTGDCLFIIVSLWLSLINTGLPGSYLVSLPSIWLAPVILAFGTLRFNPLLQAYLIALLVVGLAALTFWGGEPGLAREEAAGLAQIFFAPSPNVMRYAMLTLAGLVLVVASMRARRLLITSIEESQRRHNLTRYLPQQVADRLAEGGLDELRRGRRQNLGIIFIDIRRFTQRSQTLEPGALSAFVTEFRRRVARAAHAKGGTIDKFIGDAAMLVFGLSERDRNAAADTVTCAEMLLAEMQEWSDRREQEGREAVLTGIGLHWGEVFCGAVGDEERLEFSVFGDTVNIAARLEDLTKQAGYPIVASRDVLQEAGIDLQHDRWHRLHESTLRGWSGTIELFGSHGIDETA